MQIAWSLSQLEDLRPKKSISGKQAMHPSKAAPVGLFQGIYIEVGEAKHSESEGGGVVVGACGEHSARSVQ